MQDIFINQELLWLLTVVYDLGLALLLFRFFGKYGLYTAVILGIMLANLQGGKISELELFGYSFTASMGAILYSGIYFATDILNERYGKKEADRAHHQYIVALRCLHSINNIFKNCYQNHPESISVRIHNFIKICSSPP